MNQMTTRAAGGELITEEQAGAIRTALKTSLYPGASDASVDLVLAYCKAAGLDPMKKPVHIVPMWDNKTRTMRDVVMPGIGLYRTDAARTGEFAGMSKPVFGPMVTENVGGREVTFPEWCEVTVWKARRPSTSRAWSQSSARCAACCGMTARCGSTWATPTRSPAVGRKARP